MYQDCATRLCGTTCTCRRAQRAPKQRGADPRMRIFLRLYFEFGTQGLSDQQTIGNPDLFPSSYGLRKRRKRLTYLLTYVQGYIPCQQFPHAYGIQSPQIQPRHTGLHARPKECVFRTPTSDRFSWARQNIGNA